MCEEMMSLSRFLIQGGQQPNDLRIEEETLDAASLPVCLRPD